MGLRIPSGSTVMALREQLHTDTNIPTNRIIIAEMNEAGFNRVLCDAESMATITDSASSLYCIEVPETPDDSSGLTLCLMNVKKCDKTATTKAFGAPFCIQVNRDISHVELQKLILKHMAIQLKPETFAYTTPIGQMFKLNLQDPTCDPDTYLEPTVEHPLFTEIIDNALIILSPDAGPAHVKLHLEWTEPEKFFISPSTMDEFVEHESVSKLKENMPNETTLTLEQCLEHYTRAETLSTEDAWRCPQCKEYLPVVKTLGLWSLPDVLIIHLKRFRQQQYKGPQAAKLTTMVEFPLTSFDMTPHLANSNGTAYSTAAQLNG
jgi:ubiquitin carboxyl-terminal hydrolase 31